MITFSEIEIENFGPYRGRQSLTLGERRGVWVIYGENGRGKTSILNAFRYVLYGKVHGRLGEVEPGRWANKLARQRLGYGKYQVTLRFDVDERTSYEVTRKYDESSKPRENVIVTKNGVALKRERGREEMETLFPPALSGFFLFDGEDLRQYEYLLDQDSAAAEKLKATIEKVLGIPILYRAAAVLRSVEGEVNKIVADHAAKNEQTRKVGRQLQVAQQIKDEHEEDLRKERVSLEEKMARLERIDEELRQDKRAHRVLASLDEKRARKKRLTESLEHQEEGLLSRTQDLWKMNLRPVCRIKLEGVEAEISRLETRLQQHTFADSLREKLKENANECPVCRQGITDDRRSFILKNTRANDGGSFNHIDELHSQREKRGILQNLLASGAPEALRVEYNQVQRMKLENNELEGEIAAAEEVLSEIGKSETQIRHLQMERENIHHQKKSLEERIAGIEESIRKQDEAIQKLRRELQKGPSPLDTETRQLEIISKRLRQLFAETAEVYREDLKRDVEDRGSRMFAKISPEEDYHVLSINQGYGLEIMNVHGDAVPNRSAGFEHLVALSLLAALQESSPHQGPLVVDHPFGRLDPGNTFRVMRALPEIANQSILLVFEDEFDREAAAVALGELLVQEYQLIRESSLETAIQLRRD